MKIDKALGKTCWIIPDGYIPKPTDYDKGNRSGYVSHECACVLNTAPEDVEITLSFYFEDCDPVFIEAITIPAQRSCHLRIDQLTQQDQPVVPAGKPYSLIVQSTAPIVVQMSRLDTTQDNMAFLSTMAFPIE